MQVGHQQEHLGEIVALVGVSKVQLREQLAGKLLDTGVAPGEEGQVGMAAGLQQRLAHSQGREQGLPREGFVNRGP